MKINIYQIDSERDGKRLKFFPLSSVERLCGTHEVDSSLYNKVYSADVSCNNLEDVFKMFNTDHPIDYFAHSLSVSDVVEIVEGGSLKKGFYYCDDIGFVKISFDADKAVDNTNKNRITVLYIEPKHPPKKLSIPNELKAMQKLVDGYIEEYYPFDDNAVLVCNEEGKMKGLPLNRAIYTTPDDKGEKKTKEIIAGSFFICCAPVDSENYQSLSDEQIKKYSEMFKKPERFYNKGDDIKVYPIEPKHKDYER